MRLTMLILLAAVAAPSMAAAQPYDNYPVCRRVYGPVRYDECHYTSIAQCRPAAAGTASECVTNPWYQAPSGATGRRYRH